MKFAKLSGCAIAAAVIVTTAAGCAAQPDEEATATSSTALTFCIRPRITPSATGTLGVPVGKNPGTPSVYGASSMEQPYCGDLFREYEIEAQMPVEPQPLPPGEAIAFEFGSVAPSLIIPSTMTCAEAVAGEYEIDGIAPDGTGVVLWSGAITAYQYSLGGETHCNLTPASTGHLPFLLPLATATQYSTFYMSAWASVQTGGAPTDVPVTLWIQQEPAIAGG